MLAELASGSMLALRRSAGVLLWLPFVFGGGASCDDFLCSIGCVDLCFGVADGDGQPVLVITFKDLNTKVMRPAWPARSR
jgi:hypothetical protein